MQPQGLKATRRNISPRAMQIPWSKEERVVYANAGWEKGNVSSTCRELGGRIGRFVDQQEHQLDVASAPMLISAPPSVPSDPTPQPSWLLILGCVGRILGSITPQLAVGSLLPLSGPHPTSGGVRIALMWSGSPNAYFQAWTWTR